MIKRMEKLVIGGRELKCRVLVGRGKLKKKEVMGEGMKGCEREMVRVGMKGMEVEEKEEDVVGDMVWVRGGEGEGDMW